MKYRLLGLCAGLLSLSLAVACGSSSKPESTPSPTGAVSEAPTATPSSEDAGTATVTATSEDTGPVAVVNGEEISREDFNNEFAQAESSYAQQGVPLPQGENLALLRQDIVQQLVQRLLVLQETRSRDIEATTEEIDAQYEVLLSSFPDEETYNAALEATGLTEADVEALIVDDIKVKKLLDSVIEEAALSPPTEEELQAFYDEASLQQELPPFEELRADVEAELMDRRQNEVLQAFVDDLAANASVEILLDL